MAISAAGYVGAAVIAAGAAFVGMVLGKEQKTTEFRQDWINAQRNDIACMLALAANSSENLLDNAKPRANFDEAFARVRLRENPDTPEWNFVIAELCRLRSASDQRVVALTQRLLKDEWMRVRGGERSFKVAKYVLPPTIFLVGVALAWGEGFIIIH